MPSKARQLADDIRGAVTSLPSHLDPLCQAIAAKGGPKPPPGLLPSSVPLKPHMLTMNACAQLLRLYRTQKCLPKWHLLCSLFSVSTLCSSSPACMQGCSIPHRALVCHVLLHPPAAPPCPTHIFNLPHAVSALQHCNIHHTSLSIPVT